MKKLLAILLSMLLLCSMIPFATVSAADEHTIELVADAEEVDAGDEVAVEVSIYGHESVGLIGAQIQLGYDPEVFELVTYYDEDEEMWMPPIEVGSKFNASSNKYIMFPPIDEETGYMERCQVQFVRATASATQAVKNNLFYTVTFKVKDDAVSGDYEIDVINFNPKNLVRYNGSTGLATEATWEPITITVNGSEPAGCEHEYEYDCSKVCSKCGEETRPEAEHQYFYACDPVCMICYEMTNPEAAHSMSYVEAKDATCTENGNIAYWTCDACGGCWDNENATGMPLNRMMVIIPATGHAYSHDFDASCNNCGEIRTVDTIITPDGKSISEDVNGLAFKFNVNDDKTALNLWKGTLYKINYGICSVTGSKEYKLVEMGAKLSNGKSTAKAVAEKVVDVDSDAYFVVRVLNIPEASKDTVISATPYFAYDLDGDLSTTDDRVVVYGEEVSASYNEVAG